MQLAVLAGHQDGVNTAAFSPDGSRIVTASVDKAARIWDANTSPIEAQIEWAEAAQFDPLAETERFQLGLAVPAGVRRWPARGSTCDESAAAPYDPERRGAGVMLDAIVTDIAVDACANSKSPAAADARWVYQRGRVHMATGDFAQAGGDFEQALALGYGAAGVDLAVLMSTPADGMFDVRRAVTLLEQAWKAGIVMAGFELGSTYEHGVNGPGGGQEYLLRPDPSRAWDWYEKAANAGQPNALARFGGRAEQSALSATTAASKNSHLLEAFKYYAAAADRARSEAWPDESWRYWRYRRASLARLLAHDAMMQEVAMASAAVHRRDAPPPSGLWQRLKDFASP
jgi:tetratricopeptide (TPR) repeat protein